MTVVAHPGAHGARSTYATPRRLAAVALAVTLGATACGDPTTTPIGAEATTDAGSPVLGTGGSAGTPSTMITDPGDAGPWPAPEDCVSYDPGALTGHYEAGVHGILANGVEILRVRGGPDDVVGEQAYALAKSYSTVCFIGRGNVRDDKEAYIFEYWKNPSNLGPVPISDRDGHCVTYDPAALRVASLGAVGWTIVDDDDRPMGQFDTEADANDVMIVLRKYDHSCGVWSDIALRGPAISYTVYTRQ